MKYHKKHEVHSDGVRRSTTRMRTYDPLEHTLKRLFKVQNTLLKRACEKTVPNKPKQTPFAEENVPAVLPNKPVARTPDPVLPPPPLVVAPVPPPPPPPPIIRRPPTVAPVAPPPPPIQRPQTLQRKKPTKPVFFSGPSINFENLKRKSREMRAKQIDQLLQTDQVVRSLMDGMSNTEKDNIRKRLIHNHEGLDANTVKTVIRYKTTLNRLRADNRLQNKPEAYLMNDIRPYLNPEKNLNKNAITDALYLKNIERAIIRLGGTNLKRGEIPVLVRRLRNKRPENLTVNDISNAL
jgi:hypothetical protein